MSRILFIPNFGIEPSESTISHGQNPGVMMISAGDVAAAPGGADALLQEDGASYILQEDGTSHILLE